MGGVAWCNGYHLYLPLRRPGLKPRWRQLFILLLDRTIKFPSAVSAVALFKNQKDGREASFGEIV